MKVKAVTKTMYSILIPTDFSMCSRNAELYAAALFRDEHIKAVLVNVQHIEGLSHKEFSRKIGHSAEFVSEETSVLTNLTHDNWRVVEDIEVGEFSQLSNQVIKEHSIDLLVMGTKGLKEDAYGRTTSNAGSLVNKLIVSMLIVPSQTVYTPPKKIVLALDLDDEIEDVNFEILEYLIARYNSKVHIGYINSSGENLSKRKEVTLDYLKSELRISEKCCHEIRNCNIIEGISKLSKSEEANMIVVIGQHRSLAESIGHYSITKKLTEIAELPLLILKKKI